MDFGTLDKRIVSTMARYSTEQKYDNYMRVLTTIKFLEENQRITEDWMESNKARIELYREWSIDYSDIHDEIDEKSFRSVASKTEYILQILCEQIRDTKTFDPRLFLQLNYGLKDMIESVLQNDELASVLSDMTI
jgi:hypothetical protein